MLTLVSYRPIRPARRIQRRAVGSFARSDANPLPLNVAERQDEFVVTAAVPGLQPEALHLEVLGDTVTLRAEEAAPAEAQDGWLLRERRPVTFARTLRFPTELDGAKAEASLENGLLTVRLPKAETAKPKMVKVKAN
ncbi:MAG: Hsp20/alpha crystallin family protein [Anaerolineales bacterium]